MEALDPLEHLLMILCGISIAGFTLSVFCDVVTRELGRPWLWLQLVTTGFFAWGVFIGKAAATRRIDHLNLVEITKRMRGPKRSFIEITNHLIILVVGLAMLVSRCYSQVWCLSAEAVFAGVGGLLQESERHGLHLSQVEAAAPGRLSRQWLRLGQRCVGRSNPDAAYPGPSESERRFS